MLVTMTSGEVRQTPRVNRVPVLLESQMTPDLRGRRVRLVNKDDQWVDEVFHVYGKGVEVDGRGHSYVEVLPADEHWRMVHTRQLNVTLVVRWPAGAVFMD